jgi:PPP family 3-phenylpropionic acid transporter
MPYWRLSSFYFFYFAALGALVPYWGLYLQSRGFDAVAIGSLMALLMATKIVAPNVWGWLGDHLGHRMVIVRLASLIAALVFVAMFWAEGFWGIALVMLSYSFFWNASLPQFEVVTFSYLGEQVKRYSLLRLWGSVGFIVSVILLGVLIDLKGTEVILWAVLATYLGIFLVSLSISDPVATPHALDQGSIFQVLKQPAILAFFVAVFLMQAGHGPYYAFYSIYLEAHGYSKITTGLLWGVGVLAEVLLFLFMHRLLKHSEASRILVVSLLLAAVRWLMVGYFPDSLWVLFAAQLLHAATFGSFHAAAIHLVHHYFQGRHKGRGQALYASLSFGAGGAIGSLGSGFMWQHAGASLTYTVAAAVSLVGALVAWRYLDRSPGNLIGSK